MPIEVPDATLSHLEHAPLTVAVAQVRYSPVHAVEKRELVADFQARLDDTYIAQDAEKSQTVTLQFGVGPQVLPLRQPVAADTVWPFRDKPRGYAVSLSNSSLAVEADASYHDFPQFMREFRAAVDACAAVFGPKQQLRLGLRYVNEINDGRLASDISALINPELVLPYGTAVTGGLLRSFAEMRVHEALGTFVVRHGLIDDQKYLLDFDYFSEATEAFSAERVVQTIEGFHSLIEPFFVWSVTPGYLSELQEEATDAD